MGEQGGFCYNSQGGGDGEHNLSYDYDCVLKVVYKKKPQEHRCVGDQFCFERLGGYQEEHVDSACEMSAEGQTSARDQR